MSNQSEPPVSGLAAFIPAPLTNSSSFSGQLLDLYEERMKNYRNLMEVRYGLADLKKTKLYGTGEAANWFGVTRAEPRAERFYKLKYDEIESAIELLQHDLSQPRLWVTEPESQKVVPEEWGEVAP
jgi:hypothetical protein